MHAAPLRGPSFDALMTKAGEAFRIGDDAAVMNTLLEAGAALPKPLPEETAWRVRAMNLHRAEAGLAQKQGRHADAVTAFEAAIAALPTDQSGDRDALAARLQLLVRMARSRLSLGQAAETEAEMAQCEAIIETLAGSIPSGALDTVRAAVLGHSGATQAILGKLSVAEEKFLESVALIDKLSSPDLASLKQQVIGTWAGALRRAGRTADADALLSGLLPSRHAHDAACGCGNDHAHGHHHEHDHKHHEGCGCGSH